MTIKVWNNFSKRRNSTKRPTGGTDVTVTLKDNVNVENPSFILSSTYSDIVYVQYEGSYYWVDSVTRLNNTQILVSCSMDSLATYKNNILATTALCMYSSAGNPDNIPDNRIIALSDYIVRKNSAVFRSDCFAYKAIIATTSVYGLKYYDCLSSFNDVLPTWAEIKAQVEGLFGHLSAEKDGIVRAMNDIMGAIVDCYYVPVSTNVEAGANDVYYGQYKHTFSSLRASLKQDIGSRIITETATVGIPWARADWRRRPPYSEVYLYVPYFGIVSLTDNDLSQVSTLSVKSAIDQLTGDIRVEISKTYGQTSVVIKTLTGNVAVKVQLGMAGFQIDRVSQATGVLSAGLNLAGSIAKKDPLGAISNIAGGAISALMPPYSEMCQTSGSCSGAVSYAFENHLECYVVEHNTSMNPDDIATTLGKPDAHIRTLSSLSGFVQTVNASVSIAGTPRERDYINSMLDSGIYLE